jgi:hypothetical protein
MAKTKTVKQPFLTDIKALRLAGRVGVAPAAGRHGGHFTLLQIVLARGLRGRPARGNGGAPESCLFDYLIAPRASQTILANAP